MSRARLLRADNFGKTVNLSEFINIEKLQHVLERWFSRHKNGAINFVHLECSSMLLRGVSITLFKVESSAAVRLFLDKYGVLNAENRSSLIIIFH